MFIDTSAVVAILSDEPEADRFLDLLADEGPRITAPHVRLESSMILAGVLGLEVELAEQLFEDLLVEAGVEVVPITDRRNGARSSDAVQRRRLRPHRPGDGTEVSGSEDRLQRAPWAWRAASEIPCRGRCDRTCGGGPMARSARSTTDAIVLDAILGEGSS